MSDILENVQKIKPNIKVALHYGMYSTKIRYTGTIGELVVGSEVVFQRSYENKELDAFDTGIFIEEGKPNIILIDQDLDKDELYLLVFMKAIGGLLFKIDTVHKQALELRLGKEGLTAEAKNLYKSLSLFGDTPDSFALDLGFCTYLDASTTQYFRLNIDTNIIGAFSYVSDNVPNNDALSIAFNIQKEVKYISPLAVCSYYKNTAELTHRINVHFIIDSLCGSNSTAIAVVTYTKEQSRLITVVTLAFEEFIAHVKDWSQITRHMQVRILIHNSNKCADVMELMYKSTFDWIYNQGENYLKTIPGADKYISNLTWYIQDRMSEY